MIYIMRFFWYLIPSPHRLKTRSRLWEKRPAIHWHNFYDQNCETGRPPQFCRIQCQLIAFVNDVCWLCFTATKFPRNGTSLDEKRHREMSLLKFLSGLHSCWFLVYTRTSLSFRWSIVTACSHFDLFLIFLFFSSQRIMLETPLNFCAIVTWNFDSLFPKSMNEQRPAPFDI